MSSEAISEIVCPVCRSYYKIVDWCRTDDGRAHKGARCTNCRRWLRWLPPDNPQPWTSIPLYQKGASHAT